MIREIHKYLGGHREGAVPDAYIEYILMTKLWCCPPSVFEEQSEEMIDLHIRIYSEELKRDRKEQRRAQQDSKF